MFYDILEVCIMMFLLHMSFCLKWIPYVETNLPKHIFLRFLLGTDLGTWSVDTVERASDRFCRLEIEPQVFLLRWIRLLFCREFDLQDGGFWGALGWALKVMETGGHHSEASYSSATLNWI